MKTRRGLSLVEVLVALALLSFSMLALLPVFGVSVKTNASAGQLATANTLCREKLEQLIGYPSTNDVLKIPNGKTIADSTNSTACANDLPRWYNPTTGQTSNAATIPTSTLSSVWFPYPVTRTYTVQAFVLSDMKTPVASNVADETSFDSGAAAPYYDVKLVTVTVQPANSPLPGIRRTTQSAFLKYKVKQ